MQVKPDRGSTDVVGARIGAQIVDLLVMFVQFVAVGALLLALVRPDRAASAETLVYLGGFTLPLYGGLLEGYWNGQTLGKRAFGIKVVDRDGHDPTVGQAVVRNLPAVLLGGWLPALVALAAIATSDRRQRVFDEFAETYVVRA